MVLNMGPQHPSTHGVLRLVLEIDGETVVSLAPDIGYLHTGIEKTCEAKFYQQVVPLTDRIDYLCPMTNNLAYCLAVEKLLGLEIPERAQYIRVLLNELTRIQSHLVWLGTHAMDIGALTVFLYCFREREDTAAHLRGRLRPAHDDQLLPHRRRRRWSRRSTSTTGSADFLNALPSKIDEYEGLLTGNPIWIGRLKGVGYLSPEDAIALGVTGPPLRASRRRLGPAPRHALLRLREVPVQGAGLERRRRLGALRRAHGRDARVGQDLPAGAGMSAMPRGRIIADAPKIILPDREQMKTQMESLIHHFKIVTEGFAVPAGEVYQASKRRAARWATTSSRTAPPSPIACTCATPTSPRCRRSRPCARAGCSRMWSP